MTPTDPAPRGADAPDFEMFALRNAVETVADYQRDLEVPEHYQKVHNAVTKLLAFARRAIVPSPVPAEATSGAEPSEEYQRGFSDGYDTAASISVTGIEGAVDVLDALVAEGEPCEHDTGHCSCKQRQALESVRTYLAALRTPPAPLPREGAMRTEIESAMRELLDIRMDDLRCPVGITDEAFAGAALGAWKRIRYAMEHLTAALTPAAPTTTKETR